ncbi:hypothetical protein HG15A2_42260 [Adhaeretor mobilis]|uniref:Uncharacterized protein n=1 Tax=Adhaeretor mobilis TaxID=1930276 RepID=A0A517N179_9BACT|nr:hypothetical protein HG15A2_42260 [Adhaeretor mobilis]
MQAYSKEFRRDVLAACDAGEDLPARAKPKMNVRRLTDTTVRSLRSES